MKKIRNCSQDTEKGAALVLVLIIMMALILIGTGVITSTSTNVALSRNYESVIQAQNMSEIGVKVAYRELINSGFLQTTHVTDNKSIDFKHFNEGADVPTGDELLVTELDNYTVDEFGNFMWEWDDSQPYDPMWDTDKPHGFSFHVYYTTDNAFVIEAEGWYGAIHKRTRAKGEIETMFQFSYFASSDLGEFVRGASQEIRGKVHANGTMFVRPSGSTLRINTDSFTSTGPVVRSRDAWGRPDGWPSTTTGKCEITKDQQDSDNWVEMLPGSPRGSEGIAFDSNHSDWTDKDNGARKLWGGVVRDKVPYKSPPPVQGLDPDGYYNQLADDDGLVIDNVSHSESWCTKITDCWNYNEQRYQVMWEINVGDMMTAEDWPSNNLIYCKVPVRLANADSLQGKLMIASCRNVYTLGDFNTTDKKGASIMTKHRIMHLSSVWSDAQSKYSKNRAAADTRINGAMVDGAPTVDEYNWCDRDGDNHYDYNGGIMYDPESPKTKAGYHDPYNSGDPWANCDDLLEDWSGKVLTKFGSVVHLGSSNDVMADNLDNSGIQDDQIAWIRKTGYSAPTRNYLFDPELATTSGQPPFTPLIGHITSWEPY